MGEVRVPAAAKWRAQTQRAVENFPISGRPIERELIAALASIKGAAAMIRATSACWHPRRPTRSSPRRARSPTGSTTISFPIDVFQTGSGTSSSNMNANEVLASHGRCRTLGRR